MTVVLLARRLLRRRERGRWGVKKILNLARPYEKHSLEWWQQWLADHWDEGG